MTPTAQPKTSRSNPDSSRDTFLFRRCRPCATLYATSSMVPTPELCPVCGQPNTKIVPVGEPSGPKQTLLFTIPPPPVAIIWCVEWRWAKKSHGPYKWMKPDEGWHPEGDNPWQRYSISTGRLAHFYCHKSAINQRARLSKIHPWKSFRVTAVGFMPTPLVAPFPGAPKP